MELIDTIEMMQSEDHIERFKAEYYQAKIRYEKLEEALYKHEAGTLEYAFNCPVELLKDQKRYMEQYIRTLRVRAEIEHIEL